jgi:hypothetical protein
LAVVPFAALVASVRVVERPPVPGRSIWPDVAEDRRIAEELVRRGLTHGFSDNWNANILTLLSRGRAKTCPVFFDFLLVPQRWHVEKLCYDAGVLPDRFFVVAFKDSEEHLNAVRNATRSEPVERFSVGSSYAVSVFRTADAGLGWLELPLAEGERMQFPLRLPATHVLFRRHRATEEGGQVVATGEPGSVLYGPYIRVPPGDFRVRWIGSGVASTGDLLFDVTVDGKGVTERLHPASALAQIRNAELAELDFSLSRTSVVELRVSTPGGGRVAIGSVTIERR